MEASTDNWTGDDLEPTAADVPAQSIHASYLNDAAELRAPTTDAGNAAARHGAAARDAVLRAEVAVIEAGVFADRSSDENQQCPKQLPAAITDPALII